ncbi:hypothetical protein CA13_39290 [Planctomycetes bacterium CA13]|uniref:Uncharacterized protein n=1 Tax=Novipirellula herctigrandis TaxID=2527986 RepID=A0A5C5Z5W8_9BACT|nr:hypothetical protein CA13_39290 [Planctomycetes bacterium CA13]
MRREFSLVLIFDRLNFFQLVHQIGWIPDQGTVGVGGGEIKLHLRVEGEQTVVLSKPCDQVVIAQCARFGHIVDGDDVIRTTAAVVPNRIRLASIFEPFVFLGHANSKLDRHTIDSVQRIIAIAAIHKVQPRAGVQQVIVIAAQHPVQSRLLQWTIRCKDAVVRSRIAWKIGPSVQVIDADTTEQIIVTRSREQNVQIARRTDSRITPKSIITTKTF